ncbi:MAG: hypothetical protein NC311_10070 [Muribaculaceae bacterium]|nr:hypothetical protein [Muribaculaceae bacterium]
MIHAVCDFCGNDAGRSAFLLTLTPFQNFARYHTDTEPYGTAGPKKSYCLCQACHEKMGLPNPYHDYFKVQDQPQGYEKTLENYSGDDFKEDARRKRAQDHPAMGRAPAQTPPGEKGRADAEEKPDV